ncbi:MAG: hypothetical protein ACTSR8_03880 [Promethearchaeota archaeon]
MRFFPEFVFFFLLPILFTVEVVVLKIALSLTHAPEKKNLKWVLASFGIQIAVIFFVASPLILMGMTGGFDGEESGGLITAFIFLALFIDMNILNVIHKLGMKKAFIVFIAMLIPFFVTMFLVFGMLAQVGQGPFSS